MDKQEVLRYLGHTGQELDDEMDKQLLSVMKKVDALKGKVVYKVFDFTTSEMIELTDTLIKLPGNSIRHILSQSQRLVLFAGTLGAEVDQWIHKSQYKSSVETMFVDACANVRIEAVLDDMCRGLPGYQTPRFSPGYGDLPLELQSQILDVLEAKRIGLTVTGSSLLIPKKSVTGIIGLSDEKMDVTYRFCDDCLKRTSCDFKICSRRNHEF